MEPLIPIWIIYLSGIVDDLKATISSISAFMFWITLIIAVVMGIVSAAAEELELFKTVCKKCFTPLIVSGVLMILSVLVPSQKTMYTIMIGSQITPNNIQLVGGTVKNTVDYMFEKTEELIKTVKGDE